MVFGTNVGNLNQNMRVTNRKRKDVALRIIILIFSLILADLVALSSTEFQRRNELAEVWVYDRLLKYFQRSVSSCEKQELFVIR